MPAPIGDSAYVQAAQDRADAMRFHASMDVAIQSVLYLWRRKASSSISDMQNEIAKRQTRLAEEITEHAKKFWPYEKAMVDDAFGLSKATAQYAALSLSWAAYADTDQQAYKAKLNEELSICCLNPNKGERAVWDRNRQLGRANVMSFADRIAEGRMDKLNTIRFAKQYAALGLGRKHLANVPSFMSLGGAARAHTSQLLLGLVNSGMEAYGYYRRGTDYWGSRLESRWGATPYSRVNQLPAYEPQVNR